MKDISRAEKCNCCELALIKRTNGREATNPSCVARALFHLTVFSVSSKYKSRPSFNFDRYEMIFCFLFILLIFVLYSVVARRVRKKWPVSQSLGLKLSTLRSSSQYGGFFVSRPLVSVCLFAPLHFIVTQWKWNKNKKKQIIIDLVVSLVDIVNNLFKATYKTWE